MFGLCSPASSYGTLVFRGSKTTDLASSVQKGVSNSVLCIRKSMDQKSMEKTRFDGQ